MTQDYGMTIKGSFSPDSLVAGAHPVVEIPVTVAATSVTLSRGQVLAVVSASGKYTKLNTSAVDGSQTPVAILGVEIAPSVSDTKSFAYVHGEFAAEAITGLSTPIKAQLQARGIYVKG